jgi:hypothetical protein
MTILALIGAGSSATGYLAGMITGLEKMSAAEIAALNLELHIFDKSAILGSGAPYDATTTNPEHLLNIHDVSVSMPHLTLSEDPERQRQALIYRNSFSEWLKQEKNQIKILEEFKETFFAKFKAAYKRKFDKDFAQENILNDSFELQVLEKAELEMIHYHQQKFQTYKEKVFAQMLSTSGKNFLPRTLYGFYAKALFEHQLEKLKKLIGEEKIHLHAQTEVSGVVKRDDDRVFCTYAGDEKLLADIVFIGTGLYEEEKDKTQNPNYLHNIWPISNVEKAILKAIKKAKADGKTQAEIAIIGSSLSATDIARTIASFEDEALADGVKLHATMYSRFGQLQTVKGNFSWLISNWCHNFPRALKSTFANYQIDQSEFSFDFSHLTQEDQAQGGQHLNKISENISKIINKIAAENGDGKIYLHQVLTLFLRILQNSYLNALKETQNGQEQERLSAKADYLEELINFIGKNSANYQIIFDKLMERQNPDAFAQLQLDLETAAQGDIGGQYLFEEVFQIFSYLANYRKFLPEDEKLFLSNFHRSLTGRFDAALATEGAQSLIAMHQAGMLDICAIGQSGKINKEQNSITLESGETRACNLLINASGVALTRNIQTPLLQSLIQQNLLHAPEIEVSPECVRNLTERKYGSFALPMLASLQEQEGGFFTQQNPTITRENKFLAENIFHLGAAWGISGSMKEAQNQGAAVIDRLEEKQQKKQTASSALDLATSQPAAQVAQSYFQKMLGRGLTMSSEV